MPSLPASTAEPNLCCTAWALFTGQQNNNANGLLWLWTNCGPWLLFLNNTIHHFNSDKINLPSKGAGPEKQKGEQMKVQAAEDGTWGGGRSWKKLFHRNQSRRMPSTWTVKGPCSPKRLCTLVFLFWTASIVKFSVLIGQSVRIFHAWPKCDSTRSEDGDFQLHEIIFLEYRARKAAWVEHGPLSHMNYARPQGGIP